VLNSDINILGIELRRSFDVKVKTVALPAGRPMWNLGNNMASAPGWRKTTEKVYQVR
jgi:hypothetical protein